jgi:thiol-disulfide isomerase/thioredoxin
VRVAPWATLIPLLLLGPAGCSSLGKGTNDPDRPPLAGGGTPPAKFPVAGDPILNNTPVAPRPIEQAVLAGQIIDVYNNRIRSAHIQWVCLDEKENAAPIEVSVEEGYFTIPGLKPGYHYKLTARTKQGERLLAGASYTTAPNIRVLIRVSEDFATKGTPDLPGSPAYPGQKRKQKAAVPDPERPALAQNPDGNLGNNSIRIPSGVGIGPPQAILGEPDSPAQPNVPGAGARTPRPAGPSSNGWVPGITHEAKPRPPVVEIPGPGKAAPPKPSPPPPTPGGPPRVPSCILVGRQLVNLALYDLNGQVWEFQSQRKGKLVLLDFWGTMCIHCRDPITHLRILQSQYGWAGLEVVAIAYENGGSHQEQAHRVLGVSQRLQTNYRHLLGGGRQCPVWNDFGVRHIPTLILLDENGWILWRHEGQLERPQLEQLELLIKHRLGVR